MKPFVVEERSRTGQVLLPVEFETRADAEAFWARRMSAATPAGTYSPSAPRRLVMVDRRQQ